MIDVVYVFFVDPILLHFVFLFFKFLLTLKINTIYNNNANKWGRLRTTLVLSFSDHTYFFSYKDSYTR